MTRLYIVRHGETEWNRDGKLQGWKNAPLTDLGIKQAEKLRDRLQKEDIDIAYCSPLGRTCETAEILLDGRDIEMFEDEGLKEINMGEWEGKKAEIVKEKSPAEFKTFWERPDLYKPKDGESFYEVQERVLSSLYKIIEKHQGENILLVTHGGASKIIMAHFEERPMSELWGPPKMKEASLSVVDIEDGKADIELFADTSHYEE